VTNRLAQETSPYLLQHAENPVDWHPWGEEALGLSRAEDLPILLSIGYSACHWCHVMERESFEDPATAEVMNRNFVCIKVDREERPDLDTIYMSAVQQMTGSGGWPMTVFLTPDLKPFFGGTYFPPAPRYGMPGFVDVLDAVAEAYRERRDDVERNANQVVDVISTGIGPNGHHADLDAALLDKAAESLKRLYDPVHGGLGSAPKFPQAMALDFMLRSWKRTGDPELLEIVEKSLLKMAHGGIYDQLGGGFARYSTDAQWLVPHFEKMLYDQALLAPLYLRTFQATGNRGYLSGCTRTIDYVLRDLRSPEGGFYSAEDADSDGAEGLFYTWSHAEVQDILGDDFELFAKTFDVTPEGNWEGRNILHVAGDRRRLPGELGIGEQEYRTRLDAARNKLFSARAARVRPARDEKVLTGWNGLMLAAVAEAAVVLDNDDYLLAAQSNAELMLSRLYIDGRLMRSYRDGRARISGYLEDYACLADGLLQLYQADFDVRWYEAAAEIANKMLERFSDTAGGILYSTLDDHEQLLFRPKDFDDNAVPAGNSMAAEVLVELALLSGEDRYRQAAQEIIAALGSALASHPLFFGRLLSVLDTHIGDPLEVAIVGDIKSSRSTELLRCLESAYIPGKVVAAGPEGSMVPALLADRSGTTKGSGEPVAAYVCRGFVCSQPVSQVEDFRTQLGLPPLAPEGYQAV
jgi:uncharacterized protein YyaL (SSP411 family)